MHRLVCSGLHIHAVVAKEGLCLSLASAHLKYLNRPHIHGSWLFCRLIFSMDIGTCGYNCADPPKSLVSNTDISGIGVSTCSPGRCTVRTKLMTLQVSLAYTITAGLSVCIVLVYYVLAYRPDVHPFECYELNTTLNDWGPKSNPIDEYLLFWRLRSNSELNESGIKNRVGMRSALEHVLQLHVATSSHTMSDCCSACFS